MSKKLLPIIIILFAIALFGYQIQTNNIFNSSKIISSTITSNQAVTIQNNTPIYCDEISVNQFNTSAQPKIWFYVNLIVIILTPAVFITQGILDRNKAKKKPLEPKPTQLDTNPAEPTKEAIQIESTQIESIAPKKNSFIEFIKYGFLVLFIQNILILIFYVGILATIIQLVQGNYIPIQAMMRIYSIVFNIDFLLAILSGIGLILISKDLTYKIQSYIATAFWIIWIPIGLVPRIRAIDSFGVFSDSFVFGSVEDFEDFLEFLVNFYGSDLFLINLGSIFLTLALFYTANVLFKDQHIKGKGIITSFAITNYIVVSGFSFLLLLLLCYGTQLGSAAGSLAIVWFIFYLAKFIVVPVIGIIAGIQAFKQIK